ncbi:MAG: sulfotransferase [Rhizobiales bacterium]|nr:sulfotransferase [Hyphomicrobiales bacterium]
MDPGQRSVEEAINELPRLLQMGRNEEAEAAARALQRQFPERGDVNQALALVLLKLGKHGFALRYAEAAAKAEPENAGYLVNLGRLYVEYEMIEEALPVLEKALRIDPSLYQAPWALGEFFHTAGNGKKAIHYLKQALVAARPEKKSDIQYSIADCASSLGEIDEAERLYGDLSASERHRRRALAQIAGLRKHKTDSDIFASLQQEVRAGALASGDHAELHLAIGRIYENSGDYAKAFDHFRRSKSTLKIGFDLNGFRTVVDNIIEDYKPEVLPRFKDYGDSSRLPVFVVGMPRSGTTLTEQIIAAHAKGGGAGELMRIGRMQRSLSEGKRPAHLFDRLAAGGPERSRELAAKYVSMLKLLAPGAERAVDKMPHNFVTLGFIALLFPNARIVHCVRNPADNFISAFQNPMNPTHSYAYDPGNYALCYKQYLRLMRHWQQLLPDRIFNLRYEELTADPEEKTRQLLKFIGLPWDANCLRFHERGTMVKTFSRQQVREAVHQGSVDRWRNYEAELQPLVEILKDEMGL